MYLFVQTVGVLMYTFFTTPPPHYIQTMENDLAQSRKLASLGNRAAKDGHFGEAVRRYTEAIALYPYDHR